MNMVIPKFWAVIIIILSAYLVILVIFYIVQATMVYYPDRTLVAEPKHLGLDFEDVNIKTEDSVNIHGWFISAKAAKGTILFCHGNAGNISNFLDVPEIFHSLGCNVLVFDYRGFGRSEGKPHEQGTYKDGEAAWNYLVKAKNIKPENILVAGRSLGGAVATHIALKYKPAGLSLESSFTSITDRGSEIYPYFPVKFLSKFQYNNLEKIRKITCPVLIIHSKADEIIPFSHSRKLFEAANEPKEFLEITGPHHDGYIESRAVYETAMKGFLQKVFKN